jgi:hypothetical protein
MMKICSFLPLPLFLGICLADTRARADVLTLNAENFETETAGKNVFIKFFAPWYVVIQFVVSREYDCTTVTVARHMMIFSDSFAHLYVCCSLAGADTARPLLRHGNSLPATFKTAR